MLRLRDYGYKINFGAVDLSLNPKVGRFYNIDRSPMVKIFYHNGETVEERNYLGQRYSQDVFDYCQNFYRS